MWQRKNGLVLWHKTSFIDYVAEIISVNITPGNTNDRTPVQNMCKNLTGKPYADKGYIAKKLTEKDIDLSQQHEKT